MRFGAAHTNVYILLHAHHHDDGTHVRAIFIRLKYISIEQLSNVQSAKLLSETDTVGTCGNVF